MAIFCNVLLATVEEDPSDPVLDGGIPLTLGLCVLIFCVGFVIMHIIRPRMPRFFYPRIWNKGDYRPGIVSFANISWIFRALRTGRDDVSLMGGLYGLLYLRFQLFMLVYVVFMAIISLSIILPINILGGDHTIGFTLTTATNIPNGSPFLYSHLVICIIFILVGLFIIWWYQRIYFISKKHFRNRDFVNSHTVMIRYISRKIVNDAELNMFLESLYPNQQIYAHIGYDAKELLSLKHKKNNYIKNLARQEYTFQKTGERETVAPGTCGYCLGCCGLRAQEDSMNYIKLKIGDTSGKIKRRQQTQQKGTGVAFASFESAPLAHKVIKDFYVRSEKRKLLKRCQDQDMVKVMNAHSWIVKPAPKPNELYYEYFSTSIAEKRVRKVIFFFFVLIMALIWAIPVAILASFESLKNIPGLGEFVKVFSKTVLKNFIQGFLPSFLTSLFVMVLPFILEYLVKLWEKPDSVSQRNTSVMKHYYTFVIFNVLIFPSVFIGTLNSIGLIFTDSIGAYLQHINFALQGAFFINYIINQTFVGGIIRLTRVTDMFLYAYNRYDAVTDVETEVAKKTLTEMDYRTRFAQLMIVIASFLAFSVIVPLILVPGIAYIVLNHIIEKNNIIHVHPKSLESDSNMIPAVINMFLIAMLLFEAAMTIFFWIKEVVVCFSIMLFMIFFTLLFTAFLNFLSWFNQYRYIKYGKPLLIDWDLPQSLLENAYVHPGVVDEDENLSEKIDNCLKVGGDLFAFNRNIYQQAWEEHKELEQGEGLLHHDDAVDEEEGLYNNDDDNSDHHELEEDGEEMEEINNNNSKNESNSSDE